MKVKMLQVGQLGTTDYDSIGSYLYVGSYTADYTAVRIKKDKPVKILGKVERVWFEKSQVYARLKDGTLRTWGDGDAIKAMVDATSGSLHIGKWDYPADWPDGKGWSPRKTTVSQWKGLVNTSNAIYKADGTLWIDFSAKGDYVFAGVWSGSVPQPIFSDVPVGAYYDNPVRWAVKEGVTSGTSTTTFSPDQTCTQAQILTFLWRAAGKPAASGENPFSNKDMTAGQYFYQAMLWAWKEGLIDNADIEASPVSSLLGAVRTEVFVAQGMTPTKVTAEDIGMVEQLQAAQTEVTAEPMLPETPEQAMDEPLPDPTLTVSMMEHYGYTDHDMLPLSKDRAMELMERDITVYVLYDDNTEAMVFETEDILKHDGMFGITRED